MYDSVIRPEHCQNITMYIVTYIKSNFALVLSCDDHSCIYKTHLVVTRTFAQMA